VGETIDERISGKPVVAVLQKQPEEKLSMILRSTVLAFAFLVGMSSDVLSQTADSSLLSVDRIFASGEFASRGFGPARWVEGGDAYTTLEKSAEKAGGKDIVRYETRSGERSILVASGRLIPPGGDAPLKLENYEWSTDRRKLLIFTNSKRVWRQNTRGDYWVLDLRGGNLKKLGGDEPSSTLMFAKFSPDGDRVAYVRANNIFVEDLGSHRITQLTHDGTKTLINGTFDWVYEEEFSLRDGFRWSPDGSKIAYWQLDASGVRDFYLLNNTDSLYSFVVPVQYPKVGETLSACRVGVIPSEGGATTWFAPPGDPRNNYIARMDWADNSSEIVFQYLNRLQNTNQLILGDVRTGSLKTILTDRDMAWVDVVDDMVWLDGGRAFTWLSELDGWTHAFVHARDGALQRCVTAGDYDVTRVYRVDARREWLYFQASPNSATTRFLFRTRLLDPGPAERLTPPGARGTHNYDVSPDGRWAFHTFSSFVDPAVVELVSLPDHKTVRVLADNAPLRASLGRLKLGEVTFFRVDIGNNVLLDGWKILPPGFDSTKQYPVLENIYGEPAAQTVLDRWGGSGYLWHQMLAQRGYIIVSIDNRGTPGPRGRAWRKSIYRQIGILASQDQAAAMRKIRAWSYVDSTRIGIWGWSGGGSMTLNMLFRYPELYQVGMSVAPVPDQHLYDAIYQERYMGLPADNPGGFTQGSPITFAGNLRGDLLLVHGTGDDNVHYQGSERLINALIKANKQFQMMAYPNRSHGIYEGENTTRHLYTLLTEYLVQHLLPGPKGQ
jgi:dipeptidyl-peptidase 4